MEVSGAHATGWIMKYDRLMDWKFAFRRYVYSFSLIICANAVCFNLCAFVFIFAGLVPCEI